MNFYETRRGQKFFDCQLPKLIQALEQIADTISQPAPTEQPELKYNIKPDKEFLQNLYYGNYEPDRYQEREQIRPLSREVIRTETALRKYLPPEGTKLFEDYYQAAVIRSDAVAEQAYEAGFCTAVQMMLAGCAAPGKERHGETGTTQNAGSPFGHPETEPGGCTIGGTENKV